MEKESQIALSVIDAARILGLSRTTIYQEMAAKRLVYLKCGRRTLITRKAINAWLAAREQSSISARAA